MQVLTPILGALAAEPTMTPDHVVPYTTDAGWQGSLRRYEGPGDAVLLLHGMGANHYNWDFDPQISLAAALQERGYDVWVVQLPGDAGTVAPSVLDARALDFVGLATQLGDIVDRVRAVSGRDAVYCVGHSMGAMLLYATLDHPGVAGGIGISGAAQFEHPTWLVRAGRNARGRAGAQDVGRLAWTVPFNPVVSLVARRRHMDGALLKGLARHALDDTPVGVRNQLARWTRDGEMTHGSVGEPVVDFDVGKPLLLLAGTRDRLVHWRDVQRTSERFADASFVRLDGYGHIDPVLGITARAEVYPQLVSWLDAQTRPGG